MCVRRYVIPAAVVFVLAACGGDGGGGTGPTAPQPSAPAAPGTPTASATVAAGAYSNDFTPQEVNVTVGGTVTWTFGARTHNVVFEMGAAGAPTNVPAMSNGKASRTFNTAGSFPYDCTLHPGMTGTVRAQ